MPDDIPILLGDLLVSGKGDVDPCFASGHSEIALPSTGIVEALKNSKGTRPSSLVSKVAFVNRNLAVAWSGAFVSAQRVLTSIYKAARKSKNGVLSLDRILETQQKELKHITLIFLMRSKEGHFHLFRRGNAHEFESPSLGEGICAGSGANSFLRETASFPNCSLLDANWNQVQEQDGSGLAKAASLAGNLLAQQALSGAFLREEFGGAFEIVYGTNTGLKRLENISFIFWKIHDDWMGFSPIPLFLKISYAGGATHIKRLEGLNDSGWPISLDPRNTGMTEFVISPIHRDVNTKKIERIVDREKINMNSAHQCHCFFGSDDRGPIFYFSTTMNSYSKICEFEFDDAKMNFAIKDPNFLEQVARELVIMKSQLSLAESKAV